MGNDSAANKVSYNDSKWRTLNLPHDWSIEGTFSETYPTTFNQGALPAGIGWYRKTFSLPLSSKNKIVSIRFDGVYRNSEVWINGHYLGKRPYGYSSFQYELTPYLKFGAEKNVLAVKVDNSVQPNSRWYTGSGIYRNAWLETTGIIHFDKEDIFLTTPTITNKYAIVEIKTPIVQPLGHPGGYDADLISKVYDQNGNIVGKFSMRLPLGDRSDIPQKFKIANPKLWSIDRPSLYKVITQIKVGSEVYDECSFSFGIRSFSFDAEKGFFLNNQPLKIKGVCLHHDLGALGAAFNKRAAERQLQILKDMGCNAVRTAHNPPAPEFLDLCDRMGFLVMDEAFDMWKKRKNKFDYSVDFDEWHKRDLEDMIKRDRNHASVFMWSIGNEIREQFDSSGTRIAKELATIIKSLDPTRPVTSALTENIPEKNFIYQSAALDVLGFNYKLYDYAALPKRFPGQKLIASETASALATRGHYDMPSDSARLWPPDAKSKNYGNADYTVSAYDNTYAYWGASHEASWKAVKKYPFMAGTFVWSGFDFIGEPVPYGWPARSSYYGIVDLAGFPKDVYYMYQSEWTNKPVLHIFPHWNWKSGDSVDVWAYYNKADAVELFLNGKSLGIKKKIGDSLHVQWRVKYEPGTVKAVSRKAGKIILVKEIKTAGKPAKIELMADRKTLAANGNDLSFITVKVLDAEGNLVPDADNFVKFTIKGPAFIAGVDNGNPTSSESFKAPQRKAFNGLCLAIIQTTGKKGEIVLEARSEGLKTSAVRLRAN
ncbi:beta-galactosidase GalB [Flavisolibacter ginsenosidimutans]